MWILNSKCGHMLLEVVCSISIFMVIMFSVIPIINSTIKMKNNEEKIIQYSNILYSIRNEILWNLNSDNIDSMSKKGISYIQCSNISINKIKENSIESIITEEIPKEPPYAEITVENKDIFKIKLKIHYLSYNEEKEVFCEFIKEKYQ